MPASSCTPACSSSHASALPGTMLTSSAIARALGGSFARRASTTSRAFDGIDSAPVASTSVTKNGLPPVVLYSPCDERPACFASFATASFRERLQRQAPHDRARQIADHEAARMTRADFVGAIGHHQHRARALHAPAEELEQVERRLVGPVAVLEHDQRRRPVLELVERRAEDRVAAGLGVDGGEQLALGLARDVVQRRERPRREQGIAGAPQHARRDALLAGELLQAAPSCRCRLRRARG